MIGPEVLEIRLHREVDDIECVYSELWGLNFLAILKSMDKNWGIVNMNPYFYAFNFSVVIKPYGIGTTPGKDFFL